MTNRDNEQLFWVDPCTAFQCHAAVRLSPFWRFILPGALLKNPQLSRCLHLKIRLVRRSHPECESAKLQLWAKEALPACCS